MVIKHGHQVGGRGRASPKLVIVLLLLLRSQSLQPTLAKQIRKRLDPSYRPRPIWGCQNGLPAGAFHIVIATLLPEPMALVPWIWNLGLSGAEIWIYHRMDLNDPGLTAAAATFASFEPYPCDSRVRLQQLLPNKGREAAVYLSHIVRLYDNLPKCLVLVHDHGPASRHSLCGPFFRRVRGYYAGIREELLLRQQQQHNGGGAGTAAATVNTSALILTTGAGSDGGGRALQSSRAFLRARNGWGSGGGGGGSVTSGGGIASPVRQVLMDFAKQVVSLSSGCQENWLKGCCAQLVCAEEASDDIWMGESGETVSERQLLTTESTVASANSRVLLADAADGSRSSKRTYQGRCPFKTSRCLANTSAVRIPLRPGVQRWLYLHGSGGLYDTRYENLVVLHDMAPEAAAAGAMGSTNVGFGPLSLVRYAGPDASETLRMQTSSSRSLDYPEGAATRTAQETFAQLGRILTDHDFPRRKANGRFKSCCASLMLRPEHIQYWPKTLYEQMLSYTLDEQNSYHAALAISHHGWALWGIGGVRPEDLLRYFEVDLLQLNIRGCPGWRVVMEEVPEGA
ncbi:hypothetical protein VaNZ11_001837 [Volvox africanus]|uniref:Uncharacterized protein n=1 Tax=Volvox africanus TaxID=51714 RepID=A0ABQ5RQW7_9CHLO|nr:hypothetical protein VaNZ11_001837 [Volvox africanus]